MDLATFRASGRDVEDIGDELSDCGLDGTPGRIYGGDGGFYIERQPDGTWLLTLWREQYAEPLDQLEARLHQWCVDEGFFS